MLAINLSSVSTEEVGTDERVNEVRFEISGGNGYPLNKFDLLIITTSQMLHAGLQKPCLSVRFRYQTVGNN